MKATSGKGIDDGIESLTQLAKSFKWKKINYKTFLPKHAPIVAYIVAKTNNVAKLQYMMHACAHSSEFNKSYTESAVSKILRGQGTRLLREDQNPGPEVQRVIVCHIK